MAWNVRGLLIGIANIVFAIILFFIGLRIIFRLLAANPQTPFVSWIYDVSGAILTPFSGIFPSAPIPSSVGSVLDIPAVIALIVYAILIYLIVAAVRAFVPSVEHIEDHRHVHR